MTCKVKKNIFVIFYEEQTNDPRDLVILRERKLVFHKYTTDTKAHFKTSQINSCDLSQFGHFLFFLQIFYNFLYLFRVLSYSFVFFIREQPFTNL